MDACLLGDCCGMTARPFQSQRPSSSAYYPCNVRSPCQRHRRLEYVFARVGCLSVRIAIGIKTRQQRSVMRTSIQRRDFLKSAASVAALGSALRAGAARGMFVSLNSSLTGTKTGSDGRPTPAVEWPEFVRLAAHTRYGGADVNLNGAMTEGVDATRALFTELKITPGVVSLPMTFTRDGAAFQDGLKRLDEAAQFSAAIGCPRMMTVLPASSETPKPELQKIYKDRLEAISDILL